MTKRKPAVPRHACASCKHFNSTPSESRAMQADYGECRRFPPKIGSDGDGDAYYFWPVLPPDEWCGEFAQRLDA